MHPESDRLEAYVEGGLPPAERAVLESHLGACARCQAEVEEWRALFGLLASLPRLAPAPGFADRVLAGVRVRRPWPARAAALLARLWPRGTRGWALAAAFLAFPVVLGGALAGWLLTRPGVTPWALWVFVRDRAGEALGALAARAASGVLESTLVLRAVQAVESLVTRAGVEALGAAAALFATLMLVSAWVLYQNLFRTPSRGAHHVSLSF